MNRIYTLCIKAFTPETIPMARLAQYMQHFATLLSHKDAVHFWDLKSGSTQLAVIVDHQAAEQVACRLALVKSGEGSPDATKAQARIDRLLAEDKATGILYKGESTGAQIIAFPGVTKSKATPYGSFKQEGSLDGILISVGGADETAHLQLQNDEIKYTNIVVDRDTASSIAKHLYKPLRIFGTGTWFRDQEGGWVLKKFRVNQSDGYKALIDDDLINVIEQLRAIEGSGWKNFDDPIGTLKELREENNKLN